MPVPLRECSNAVVHPWQSVEVGHEWLCYAKALSFVVFMDAACSSQQTGTLCLDVSCSITGGKDLIDTYIKDTDTLVEMQSTIAPPNST